jgi:chromosome segregation ATPase
MPKVVSETNAGEPIVEIRGVRLVLRDGATHFSRILVCSKCGREVPGAPILNAGELGRAPHPVVCQECVRSAAPPSIVPRHRTVDAPMEHVEPPPDTASADVAVIEAPPAPTMVVLERRLSEMAEQLTAKWGEWEAVHDGPVRETRDEVRSLTTTAKELARAQEDLERVINGVVERLGRGGPDGSRLEALEGRMNRAAERLKERVEDHQSELRSHLDAQLTQLHAEIEDQGRRAASDRERAQGQHSELRSDLGADLSQFRAAVEDVARRAPADVERAEELRAGVDAQLTRVRAELSQHAERAASDVAALRLHTDELARDRQGLRERVEDLCTRVDQDPYGPRMAAVEAALAGVQRALKAETARAHSDGAKVDAAGNALDAINQRVHGLQQQLDDQASRTAAGAARLDEVAAALQDVPEELDRRLEQTIAEEARRLEALDARLHELDGRLDANTARLGSGAQRVEDWLARIDEQVNQRLDRLAERAARTAPDGRRLEALEQRLQEVVARLDELAETRRVAVQRAVRAGVSEARSMEDGTERRNAVRLDALERSTAQQSAQLSEVGDLQTVLDVGLGELRSQIAAVREAAEQAAQRDRRLETLVELPELPELPVEPERGRRGRKSADTSPQLAALATAVQKLAREHQQVRVAVATLGTDADVALRASTRASAQASAVRPLRDDIRALREELESQGAALAALRRSVRELRPPLPAKAVAKRVTETTKATQPAKATKVVKAAKAVKAAKPAVKATKATKKG